MHWRPPSGRWLGLVGIFHLDFTGGGLFGFLLVLLALAVLDALLDEALLLILGQFGEGLHTVLESDDVQLFHQFTNTSARVFTSSKRLCVSASRVRVLS